MDAAESPCPLSPEDAWPPPAALLEEACTARIDDRPASLAFALSRVAEGDARPLLLVLPGDWRRDWGLPCPQGIAPGANGRTLLLAMPRSRVDALWTMEQALRSAAFAGVIGAIDGATLTQTRRLDFAAGEGRTSAMLLPRDGAALSAARRRWRIASLPAAAHPHDDAAPGPARLRAELVRRRGGPPGSWLMEVEDATGRLGVAGRLADHGMGSGARPAAAA